MAATTRPNPLFIGDWESVSRTLWTLAGESDVAGGDETGSVTMAAMDRAEPLADPARVS